MVQVADTGGSRPVNPAAAAITAAANAQAPQTATSSVADKSSDKKDTRQTEAASTPRMAADSFTGIPETVTIKSGDTLGKLVAKYQISYEKLKELNPGIFVDGKDDLGRKRASDGHWIYPGDVIRLRAETPSTASTPSASSSSATSTSTTIANNKVVEAAKAAIDDAKLTPATWAKGQEMSEQALANAKEMLKLIPASDPTRAQYEEKVARLEREIKAVYPNANTSGASATTDTAAATPQEAFDAASDGFNQAVQTFYEASEEATKTQSRHEALRHFSAAQTASKGLSGDAGVEARERLEMMEFALTDMGVSDADIEAARNGKHPGAPAKAPSFDDLDSNQDGYLSGTELDEKARAFDADGNGRVTREEWALGQMAEKEAAWKAEFKKADANQDGWLSGTEAAAFRQFDANGDGEITEQEYLAAKRAEVMNGVYEQDFAARDLNQDGYLSGNELDAAARALDLNMDGKVTRDEYLAGKTGVQQTAASGITAQPIGQLAPGVVQPQPTAPNDPVAAFESASARFNEATTRNDLLAMTTAYQDAAYAVAYMPTGTERDTLAAQLEIMGYTLQQAYAASGTPVAAGGTVSVNGVTAQPINAGIPVPTATGATVTPAVLYPTATPTGAYPTGAYPTGAYPAQPGAVVNGYPAASVGTMVYPTAATVPAAAPQVASYAPPEIPRQTYTQVWSTPEYLDEVMGYNKQAAANAANGNNPSAQGTNGNNMAAQGTDASNATDNTQYNGTVPLNEEAVKEIDAFLSRSNADAVRDMLANRPELLYDSLPRQKAQMIQMLLEGRTNAGDRQAIVNILDMASQTEQVDYVLNELDTRYGGAGKGLKRLMEDLDESSKARALKALFTPSLMQYRQYDKAAFEALVNTMTKDEIMLLMETMGYGVSSEWMKVLSAQARQTMIAKLDSGFSLFGLFKGKEKQMIAALQAYTPTP